MVTAASVKARLLREAFDTPLLDNTMRGLWCEFMIAEGIGPACRPVGLGWHPWDLQVGPDAARFSERVRIQVKNSAALQSWNVASGAITASTYNLTWRRRPAYFETYFPNVPCEDAGFLCELFILCHHPVVDPDLADHRDPSQWRFCLVPVFGPNCAVTDAERVWLRSKTDTSGKPAATQRRPETLAMGIRGRPAIEPITIEQLSLDAVYECFAVRPPVQN